MNTSALNDRLDGLAAHLDDLEQALSGQRPEAIEQVSARLHHALVETMQCVASEGHLAPDARQRLTVLRARSAVLSAGLQRVQASVGQTLAALLPTEAQGDVTYGAQGQAPAARALAAAYR